MSAECFVIVFAIGWIATVVVLFFLNDYHRSREVETIYKRKLEELESETREEN